MNRGRFLSFLEQRCIYCGLAAPSGDGVEAVAGAVLVAGAGSATGVALCDVAGGAEDFGGSGTVVIALSGLSR